MGQRLRLELLRAASLVNDVAQTWEWFTTNHGQRDRGPISRRPRGFNRHTGPGTIEDVARTSLSTCQATARVTVHPLQRTSCAVLAGPRAGGNRSSWSWDPWRAKALKEPDEDEDPYGESGARVGTRPVRSMSGMMSCGGATMLGLRRGCVCRAASALAERLPVLCIASLDALYAKLFMNETACGCY